MWALDISPCGKALFSGGADSKIAVWHDTTKERDDAAREAEEQNFMMEQRLSNHLRHKQYEQALEIALELEKPNQVLRVSTFPSRGSHTVLRYLTKIVRTFYSNQIRY